MTTTHPRGRWDRNVRPPIRFAGGLKTDARTGPRATQVAAAGKPS